MLKITGLYTSFNEHLAPEGSLQIAKNININTPHVAEPRKGFERLTTSGWNVSTERTEFIGYWNDKLIALHNDSTSAGRSEFYYLDSGTWTFMGNLEGNDNFYTAEASGNLYITSAKGIQKRDQFATPSSGDAGMPAGIGVTASTTGASGFLANNDNVAYRAVFVREDANKNLLLGAPSNRAILDNTSGGTRDGSVRVYIPADVQIGDFARLYRSVAVANSTPPSDEMQQAAEFELTSTEVNQGYVDFTDSLDESLLGATLYTSVSQEGIENENRRPPSAQDIAVFRDCVFFANNRSRDSIKLTLVDAADMANDDTITFTPTSGSTVTLTAKAAEDYPNRQFQLYTAGTAEENTRDTAKSIARVMSHRIHSLGWNAYYIENESAGTGLGEILFERRTAEANQFHVTASNSTPLLPVTIDSSGTDTPSTRDEFVNGLQWSKPFEPEAVPLPNQTRVASKNAEIQRIVSLDEALMVFKEDGLYRVTGYYPSFEVELIDASVKLISSNSVAVLSNEIYCLTEQGITVINSTGVKSVISTPIEEDIFDKLTTHYDNMASLSFGVGHEAARRYYLFHPENSSDTDATRAYVYNIYTKAWTIHDISADCGFARESEFYLGDAGSEFVLQERSSGTNRDYADYGFGANITATSDRTITLDSGTDNITAGDVLFESTTVYATITAIDTINSQVTVASNPGFSNTAVEILTGIPTEIKWLADDLGLPMINKQVHTCIPLFKAGFAGTGTLDFSTDLAEAVESVDLAGTSLLGWGLTAWGSSPWGDNPVKKPFRQWVPRSKQRCTWITVGFRHTYGFTSWKLQGIKLIHNNGTEKTGR